MNSRKLGGILAVVFGQIYLFWHIIGSIGYFFPWISANAVLYLVLISLVLLGGAMGLAGKNAGAVFTLVGGLFILLFGILDTIDYTFFYSNTLFTGLQPPVLMNIMFTIFDIPMRVPLEAIGFVIFGLLMLRGQNNG